MTERKRNSSPGAGSDRAHAAVPHHPRLQAGVPDRRFRAGDSADPRHRRQLHHLECHPGQARPAVHGHRPGSAGPRAVRQATRRLLGRGVRQRDARPAQRARHRAGHHRGSFAGRRGGDAIRLPVPASGGTADPGRRRRRHQGRQRRLAAGLAADGQRSPGIAATAPGAAGGADWPGQIAGQGARARPAWATTCRTCCGSSTTCRSRRPRRRSAAPCGRWWTGAGRSSPCWIDVI